VILILHKPVKVLDSSRLRENRDPRVSIPPGRYDFIAIDNPYPRNESPFWVLLGTPYGASEYFWRALAQRKDQFRVTIIEL
jgi:hypothetical protein